MLGQCAKNTMRVQANSWGSSKVLMLMHFSSGTLFTLCFLTLRFTLIFCPLTTLTINLIFNFNSKTSVQSHFLTFLINYCWYVMFLWLNTQHNNYKSFFELATLAQIAHCFGSNDPWFDSICNVEVDPQGVAHRHHSTGWEKNQLIVTLRHFYVALAPRKDDASSLDQSPPSSS